MSLLSLGMTGCLKDNAYEDHEIQSNRPIDGQPSVIELKVSANNLTRFVTLAFANSTKDTVVNLVPVTLATNGAAGEDINVTVGLRPSLVTDYNTGNGTAYDVPTPSMFSLVNNGVVTIPKGSNVGYLQIKMVPADFIGHDWAIGFVINSIDKSSYTISGNLSTAVVAVATKNQYDGLYDAAGFFVHPTVPRAFGFESQKVKTYNANTVTKALGDLGDATPINITVNADNTVTITPGPGASGSTALVGNYLDPTRPAYNNTYNPATKTFMLSYGYPMPTPTRTITEKVVYVGVR
ncbi:BT_3044 domain-containing protein [Niastella caeni]|nr:DUF1735 domain-containing protein [Niastella caeni]